jgi:hypothetical protein
MSAGVGVLCSIFVQYICDQLLLLLFSLLLCSSGYNDINSCDISPLGSSVGLVIDSVKSDFAVNLYLGNVLLYCSYFGYYYCFYYYYYYYYLLHGAESFLRS